MEAFFFVIMLVLLIVFWTDLRDAKRQINSLKKRQIHTDERLAQMIRQNASETVQHAPNIQPPPQANIQPKSQPSSEQNQTIENILAQAQANKRQAQQRRKTALASLSTLADEQSHANKHSLPATKPQENVPKSKVVQEKPQPEVPVHVPKPSAGPSGPSVKASTRRAPQPPQPNMFDKGIAYAKNWLTTGNIPVKIGMLVLFSAVIAFLRYATNQGWLRLPMEYRLLGVAAAAIGALVFAWTKRNSKRSFSLTVQGGSIGILLLTTFAAVKMYGFISPTLGLVLSVAMVGLAAALALQQDAKPLVIMAIFAGFLAPIWLSDGTGSHVVLFSYYAILNLGIFWVAWQKPWRELNLLGFVFTYLIGSTWGGLRYNEAYFATTEPFVILFFGFYLLIPLRYANRQHAEQTRGGVSRYAGKTDAALLFGTPLVTLGLQAGMLHNNSDALAWSCVALGAVYAVLAWWLRAKVAYATLRQAYVGLSAGFFTLAVPIGLSAKATTVIFALEGAGAMWLGARERRWLTWLSGGLLQIAAALGFVVAYHDVGFRSIERTPVLNDFYLSALLMVLSAAVCLWVCHRFAQRGLRGLRDTESRLNAWLTEDTLRTTAQALFLWGMAWWLGATFVELLPETPTLSLSSIAYDYWLFLTLTAAALVFVRRYYAEAVVTVTQAILLLSGGVMALLSLQGAVLSHAAVAWHSPLPISEFYPLSAWSLLTWSVYAVAGWWVWHDLRDEEHTVIDTALVTWMLSLASVISVGVYQVLPETWSDTGLYWWAISAVWLLLAWLIVVRPTALRYLAERPTTSWQTVVSGVVMSVLLVGFVGVAMLSGGDSGWWLPMLNSTDALQMLIAALLLLWVSRYQHSWLNAVGGLISLCVFVALTLRMSHHWGGFSAWMPHRAIEWNDGLHLATFGFWLLLWWGEKRWLSPRLQAIGSPWTPVLQTASNCLLLLLFGAWFVLLFAGGNVGTLPWLPLLNPLAVLQWAILGTLFGHLRDSDNKDRFIDRAVTAIPYREMLMPALVLMLLSVMTLRFVHHYADIAWGANLFSHGITQMALTLVWSVLGVLTWIVGSKRESRPIWLLGALLMGAVLLKLVLIDRGHLGNLFGILSFFAYGVLCVIVGYFAPMPPTQVAAEKDF